MELTIRSRWKWWLVAVVWDPVTALFLGLLILLLFENGIETRSVPQISAGIYLFVSWEFAAVLALTQVVDVEYPWFLATKATKQSKHPDSWWSQSYWYGKFTYRLERYLRARWRNKRRRTFVRLTMIREATSGERPLVVEELPDLEGLLRAFRETNLEMYVAASRDNRPERIRQQVQRLTARVGSSGSRVQAYLRYLGEVYFDFPEAERRVFREEKEERFWEWMDRYPSRSTLVIRLIELLVGALVAILLYGVLRFAQVLPPP